MTLTAEPRLSALLVLSAAHRAASATVPLTTAASCPIAVEVAPAAAMTNGEVRFLAIRTLPFGTWQRGANQSPVYRTIVFARFSLAGLDLL